MVSFSELVHYKQKHFLLLCPLLFGSLSYAALVQLVFFLGVKSVEVDLNSQVVRILGSTPVKTMTEVLEQTGRKARLIGQGIPEG